MERGGRGPEDTKKKEDRKKKKKKERGRGKRRREGLEVESGKAFESER